MTISVQLVTCSLSVGIVLSQALDMMLHPQGLPKLRLVDTAVGRTTKYK